MTPQILPATDADLEYLSLHMRESDVQECEYCARKTLRMHRNWSILDDLRASAQTHQVWAMWVEEGLLGLGGVNPAPDAPHVGAIWFLGTDLADEMPKAMTKGSKRFIASAAKEFPYLVNTIPTSAKKRKRWLRALGFDILPQKAKFAAIGLDIFVFKSDTARI